MNKLSAKQPQRRPGRRAYTLLAGAVLGMWIVLQPQAFLNLWLTPDQQGRLWFSAGHYDRAARAFEDPRWRGISLYAAQEFDIAAQYFGQYQDAESLLARANAFAHQREYLDARDAYEELEQRFPGHPAASINRPIVQALIDANRQLSENQQAENGDMSSEQDEGPRSSEGDERPNMIERQQLSADELLKDSELTAMWLRQVQRNPSEFLASKFFLQLKARKNPVP